MSQIKGRVFDSSVYAFIADVAVSLSASGYATLVYVDGSLATRDSSISANLTSIINLESSVGNLDADVIQLDASVVRIDAYNAVQDVSILLNQAKGAANDASIVLINMAQTIQDASIIELRAYDVGIDASISDLRAYDAIQDASIILNESGIAANDASIVLLNAGQDANDASIVLLNAGQAIQDASISNLDTSVADIDASVTYLFNNPGGAGTLVGLTDVSIGGTIPDGSVLGYDNALSKWTYVANAGGGGVSQAYVDGSLAAWDASATLYTDGQDQAFDASMVTLVQTFDSSGVSYTDTQDAAFDSSIVTYIGNNTHTQSYIDGSLNDKSNLNTALLNKTANYTVAAADNNKVIECDASMTVTFPDSLDTGFQVTVVNASDGYVTLDASTILTKDSSVQIQDQYAAASAVHKGSGDWYCFGDLKG